MYWALEAGRIYKREQCIPVHPLRPLVFNWLIDYSLTVRSSTFATAVYSVQRLIEYAQEEAWESPSSEFFTAYMKRLNEGPLKEATRRNYLGFVRYFFEWVFDETDLLTCTDIEDIRGRFKTAFKGFNERQQRRSQERGEMVSTDDLRRLYYAIALEVEEAERAMEAGAEAQDAHDQVLPSPRVPTPSRYL